MGMDAAVLFTPLTLGRLTLPNRIVMAPLTRSRAREDGVPGALAADYYAQRASAGLIIAEATQISAEARGYSLTPGVHEPDQVAGWRQVTDAVHYGGGRIFLQMWHTGRVSNVLVQPGGKAPVAPSAIRAEARTWVDGSFRPTSEPSALEAADIAAIVRTFADAAEKAVDAGFDGVELHGANGYLIDQFLRDGSNRRTDGYGGSIDNRIRFLAEVVEAAAARIGSDRVGVRLSPVTPASGAFDSDPVPLFFRAVERLNDYAPVYLHVIEGATRGPRSYGPAIDWAELRRTFRGVYIANNGYDGALAASRIAEGAADLVSFGRPYIANPDLVERLREGTALAIPDEATFYGGDGRGYTDYPRA